MVVALILVALVIAAAIVVLLVNRTTGARPDRPSAGADEDPATPSHAGAAQDDATWTADRPGDPGAEDMRADQAGDPSPGPPEDDEPHA